MKYWPLLLVFAAIGAWMYFAAGAPSPDKGLFSILDDDQYRQVMAKVQELTTQPLVDVEEGRKLTETQRKNLERGVQLTKQLIAFQPREFGPYFVLAKAQKALGAVDNAIRNCEQALLLVPKNSDSPEVQSVAAQIEHTVAIYYYEKGLYQQAEAHADNAVKAFVTNPDFLAGAAAIKAQLGKLDDARLYVDTALAIDPNNLTAKDLDIALKEQNR